MTWKHPGRPRAGHNNREEAIELWTLTNPQWTNGPPPSTWPGTVSLLYLWTSITVSCSQEQESRAARPPQAGVRLHRGLIRKDGKGGWGGSYGCAFCFGAVSTAVEVQTNILQVHKVQTYFLSLSFSCRKGATSCWQRHRCSCEARSPRDTHSHLQLLSFWEQLGWRGWDQHLVMWRLDVSQLLQRKCFCFNFLFLTPNKLWNNELQYNTQHMFARCSPRAQTSLCFLCLPINSCRLSSFVSSVLWQSLLIRLNTSLNLNLTCWMTIFP